MGAPQRLSSLTLRVVRKRTPSSLLPPRAASMCTPSSTVKKQCTCGLREARRAPSRWSRWLARVWMPSSSKPRWVGSCCTAAKMQRRLSSYSRMVVLRAPSPWITRPGLARRLSGCTLPRAASHS
eukprot:Rmarinus@m.6602